jgi:hypothetical protein
MPRAIERQTYVLGADHLRRPPANDPACGVPICIEWSESELNTYRQQPRSVSTGAHRIVSAELARGEVATPSPRRSAQSAGAQDSEPQAPRSRHAAVVRESRQSVGSTRRMHHQSGRDRM